MSASKPEPPKNSTPGEPAAAKAPAKPADRLAAALRDNLKRRKEQTRARRAPAPDRHEG